VEYKSKGGFRMSASYTEKFNVLEVFEQNPYQKIMMGARIDNPDDVVVINVFKKGPHLAPDFLQTAQEALSNIIHTEDGDSEQILVTDYQEGMSLHNYLEGFPADADKRTNLANAYIQKALKYSKFNNYFKTIFLDDNQIIVRDEDLLLNELIIVDEQIENGHGFENVVEKISSTLDLIFKSGKGAQHDGESKERIDAFLSSLSVNAGVYKNLEDVSAAFKKTFIFDSSDSDEDAGSVAAPVIPVVVGGDKEQSNEGPVEEASPEVTQTPEQPTEDAPSQPEREVELEGLEVVNEIFDDANEEPEKKRNAGPLALILIALAVIAAFFAFANPFADKEIQLPEASFVRQEIDGKLSFKNTSQVFGKDNSIVMSEWKVFAVTDSGDKQLKTSDDSNLDLIIKNSGTYRVELRVQDNNKQWSKPASEEFTYTVNEVGNLDGDTDGTAKPQEKLEKYLIEYSGDNISRDTSLYRSGTESIKMDLTQGDATLTMKDLEIDNSSIVSMWMLSDDTKPVMITFKGYNGDKLVFSKEIKHVPRAANIWEMVETKVDAEGVDSMKLIFSGASTIWIDDIDISSFK